MLLARATDVASIFHHMYAAPDEQAARKGWAAACEALATASRETLRIVQLNGKYGAGPSGTLLSQASCAALASIEGLTEGPVTINIG